ncbi:MAG: PEGA domain-containing protein [Sandaracinus sp.]
MTRPLATVLAALVALLPLRARAQDDPLAQGRAARDAGDHAAALAAFTRAWEAGAAPIARAEMAREELALGAYALAETHAAEALALGGEDVAAMTDALAAVQADAAAHLGSIEIRCEGGCAIAVDGTPVGTTPLAHLIRIEPGTHVVEARRDGHEDAHAEVRVEALAVARVALSPTWIDTRPILERGGTGDGQRIAGGVILGAGGVALVIGLVALGVELDRDAFLRSDACAPSSATEPREARCPDAASTRGTYTDVARAMLLSGAALAAAGVVLLLTAPSDPAAPALACAPTLGPGLACRLRF